jgi:catechol 2,3-dioxygenase
MLKRLNAQLDHLALESRDPQRLANFYADLLQCSIQTGADFQRIVRDGRSLLFVEGSAKHLAYAGYAFVSAAELQAHEARLRDYKVDILRPISPAWTDSAFAIRDPDGNRIEFGVAAPAGLRTTRSPAARLQHVVFATPEPEALEQFYVGSCGFLISDRVLDDAGGLRSVFLNSDPEHHALAIFKASESRLDHHCYETAGWNDLRDWADHFAKRDVLLRWGPGRHGPGNNLFLFVNDPDGNWIELSAELEILEDGRRHGVWKHEERTLNSWGHGKLRS